MADNASNNEAPLSSPLSTSSMSIVEESTAHPDHLWLTPIIDHRYSPTFVRHIDSSMVPIYSHAMPDDIQQVIAVSYPKAFPRYLGVDSNSDLQVSAQCPSEYVRLLINLTEDDPVTTVTSHPSLVTPTHVYLQSTHPRSSQSIYSIPEPICSIPEGMLH